MPNYLLDVHTDEAHFLAGMADDVRRGLTERPRWLPPKYFYDEAGGRLFERITELPEYYLTRAEESILREISPPLMRRLLPADLVELGPGSCHKVRFMLDALPRRDGTRYVPVDVGRDGLVQAVTQLADDYPEVRVHAVVGDFERHLAHVPPPSGRRLALFLGSTIGNFPVAPRRALLTEMRGLLGADGRLLLGVDLVKDRHVLEAAYDDAAGVTAEFNRNVLRHLNQALGGDFVPEAFRHHAVYDAEAARIEMHLVATAPQRVRLERLDLTLDFDEGDDIWTESSYKFTRESTETMLAEAGLALDEWYTDTGGQFGLVLARPAPPESRSAPGSPGRSERRGGMGGPQPGPPSHQSPIPRTLYVHDDLSDDLRARGEDSPSWRLGQALFALLGRDPGRIVLLTLTEQIEGLVARGEHAPFATAVGIGRAGVRVAHAVHARTGWFPSVQRVDLWREEDDEGGYVLSGPAPLASQIGALPRGGSVAVVDDTIFSGLTMRTVLAALSGSGATIHAFCLRAVAESLASVAALAPVTAGFAASGRILDDVSFINASGLVSRGAIRRAGREPLAFYERPEWMEAWFPRDHARVIELCRELAAELER